MNPSAAPSSPLVAVVDRHAWYDPAIEAQALARVGARVEVSWAVAADRPPQTMNDAPPDEASRRALSRITAAFVPPSITTEDRVIEMAREASGILVVRANMSARVMDALPKLRVIGRYGIGVDNIDCDAADERGIAVVYAPGYCLREVADHALMMLLACSRKLVPMHNMMMQGAWGRDTAAPIRGLFTQTLGIIGLGQIGREVAKRGQALGMMLLASDPAVDAATAARHGATLVSQEELLSRADFVTLHTPLDASTRHLIGTRELAAMKPTAFLINTSRGPVIDEAALAVALKQRRIAGAALDVFHTEPLPAASPLSKLDNVLLTPHIAGLSDEGQALCREMIANAMAEVLAGGWPAGRELYCPRDEAGRKRVIARAAATRG
jgi:D-3-phosphoglycerate dehydrogenase